MGGTQEAHDIMHTSEGDTMIFKIHSSACDSMVSEDLASRYLARPSVGSQQVLLLTAASGATMANQEEGGHLSYQTKGTTACSTCRLQTSYGHSSLCPGSAMQDTRWSLSAREGPTNMKGQTGHFVLPGP